MPEMEVVGTGTVVELGVADDVIAELRTRLAGRKADSHAGYEMVRAGIAEVTKYRTGVDRAGKKLKADAIELQKKVNAEVNRVKGLLLEIETPLREEKAKVDEREERLRIANEEKIRVAAEAKELAERLVREAEELAAREAQQKEREAEIAQLAEERKVIEAEREELAAAKRKLISERFSIEAEIRAAEDAALNERQAKEQKELAAEKAEKCKREVDEANRLAEDIKPDAKKLRAFAVMLSELRLPELATVWGEAKLVRLTEILNQAIDLTR